MSLKLKVPLIAVLLCLISCVLIGVLGYSQSRSALQASAIERLSDVAGSKRDKMRAALAAVTNNLDGLAKSDVVVQGLESLGIALEADGRDKVRGLFAPAALDRDQRARIGGDDIKGSLYAWRHSGMHASFLSAWRSSAISDAYVVAADGTIVYSITKTDGFLDTVAALGASPLAEAARRALAAQVGAGPIFVDFQPYSGGDGRVSAFWAQPVHARSGAGQGQALGAIVFRLSDLAVAELIAGTDADGTAQDNRLAGQGTVIRSGRTTPPEGGEADMSPSADLGDAIASGGEGVRTIEDRRGATLLAAYKPLEIFGHRYVVLSAQAESVVLAAAHRMRLSMILMTSLVLVVMAALTIWLSHWLIMPIRQMAAAVRRLAEGDLEAEIPGLSRRDEIAAIAQAVQVFKENERRLRQKDAEQAEAARLGQEEKRRSMTALAERFERSVGGLAGALAGHIEDVRQRAEAMSQATAEVRSQATLVADTSTLSSANVQAVSAATEELAATVNEIGRQMSGALDMARQASREAARGDDRVQALMNTARQIGDVITLIQGIARQTNLLALNATIEAARAGQAGKGFAVVAGEVKNLAAATATATDEVRDKIKEIQEACHEVASAIQAIGSVVHSLEQMNTAVAAAVEEQQTTTGEISRNTHAAAVGAATVSDGIARVSTASERNGAGAREVLHMCGGLASAAAGLQQEVSGFLGHIRSA